MENCCHVWAGAPSCYLGPSPAASLEPFFIGITLVDVHLNWLTWFHFLILKGGVLVILTDCIFCHQSLMLQGCLWVQININILNC